ncbi:MAG: hypothetical protein WD825_13905 [Gemmatimonadaceae bacterium]
MNTLPVHHVAEERASSLDLNDRQLFAVAKSAAFANRQLTRFRRSEALPIEVDVVRRTIRFSGVSGVLNLGGASFHVRPKFVSSGEWVPGLLALVGLGIRFEPASVEFVSGTVDASLSSFGLADLVGAHFSHVLKTALNAHPLVLFERQELATTAAKGRPLVARHILAPPERRHLFPSSFSKLTTDNATAHLLAWACRFLTIQCRMPAVRSSLAQLAERLPNGRFDPNGVLPRLETLPASQSAYREAVDVALQIAAQRRGSPAPGRDRYRAGRTASFAVLTHLAFQGAVSALFRWGVRDLPVRHLRQHSLTFAHRRGPGFGSATRTSKPDDAFFDHSGQALLVSDSKYIGRGEIAGVTGSDRNGLPIDSFYQVISDALALGTTNALLVQPKVQRTRSPLVDLENWEVASPLTEQPFDVTIVRIDLDALQSPKDLIASLRDAIARIASHERIQPSQGLGA